MLLTRRRMQFLQLLMDLYKKTNLPVHYETLAQSLSVSKWTAYDMLKEIEKLGFLSRSYEVNAKDTGRSQVVYIPTSKAFELFEQKRNEAFNPMEWKATIAKINALLTRLKSMDFDKALQKMFEETSKAATRIDFCAYIIGLLLIYLRKLDGKNAYSIYHLVSTAPNKETGMTVFVGTVLGMAFASLDEEIGVELSELVSQYLKSIVELAENEKTILNDFLLKALHKV
ncbi:Lrp/AsnC family transcriptional regulator [Paenibacillus sp. OAS669]|uniref:Lrp/AsnC family transcriptional regulator n=1 Tax=Paenibacillus sp. OAS669 TaxID=2663821 RepID=UPI0017894ADA|nr:Lrp/AsnC family transcriptional regulator [Paenibacillus sp. OAS669]MBE1440625.1 putative transcriptional regulator [Paenibacillus sp. OAS669]